MPATASFALDPSSALPGERMVLRLELPGPGRPADPERDLGRLRARGVDYVLVNGGVADRVRAAGGRYPAEARFYDALEAGSRRVLRVEPGDGLAGPWVAVYRL